MHPTLNRVQALRRSKAPATQRTPSRRIARQRDAHVSLVVGVELCWSLYATAESLSVGVLCTSLSTIHWLCYWFFA